MRPFVFLKNGRLFLHSFLAVEGWIYEHTLCHRARGIFALQMRGVWHSYNTHALYVWVNGSSQRALEIIDGLEVPLGNPVADKSIVHKYDNRAAGRLKAL